MANSWFRLYAEFASDAKVQMLSEPDQRRLVMLFCFRCNGDVTLQDEEVTFLLRISNDEWLKTKALFIERGFINSDNEVLNWDKRQFVSDSSAERVARHRQNKKNAVTDCNVTVTPPEQNRTEQNRSKSSDIYSPEFEIFWKQYPKKTGKGAANKSWIKVKPDVDKVLTALAWQTKSKKWIDGYVPNPETYINQRRFDDEPDTQITKLQVAL